MNTYVAKVTVEVSGYMEDTTTTFEKFFTISAESEKEAHTKINNYYYNKSDEYSVYYYVRDIDLFEHIS